MLTENEFLSSCQKFLQEEVISHESWTMVNKYLVKKNHIRKRKEIRKMDKDEEETDLMV
jgi:hypothetical protein